jgi:hypothetical protein
MKEPSAVIAEVCDALASHDDGAAANLVEKYYPFEAVESAKRQYSAQQMTDLFVRDGFIDRYRGTRLIFPPTLRLISDRLPEQFLYHRNWKMSETHSAFWELTPTVDHIQPIALGGCDEISNWASCSMLTNSIKANWLLEKLGWELLPAGDLDEWDGLLFWFVRRMEEMPKRIEQSAYYKRWYAAARTHTI